jgi:hypothetical protein
MENLVWFGRRTSSLVTQICLPDGRHGRARGDLISGALRQERPNHHARRMIAPCLVRSWLSAGSRERLMREWPAPANFISP